MGHLAKCAVVQILEPCQLCCGVVRQVLPKTLLSQLLYISCFPHNLLHHTIMF